MSIYVRGGDVGNLDLTGKLTKVDKKRLVKMIARIAESSYRRGAQQAIVLQERGELGCNLEKIRFSVSLDKAPSLETGKALGGKDDTALERLYMQHEPQLVDAGIHPEWPKR